MIDQASFDSMLRRVDVLGREISQLRRELLRGVRDQRVAPAAKPSLFGSVKARDITDDMIEESKRELFRSLDDL